MTQPRYEPRQHAVSLGIVVVDYALRSDNALWVPDVRTILLRPRLPKALERSVLAHEIVHAEMGHRETTRKNEQAADRGAAERLIDPSHLLDLMRWRPEHPALWCDELEVTHELMLAYLRVHRLTG